LRTSTLCLVLCVVRFVAAHKLSRPNRCTDRVIACSISIPECKEYSRANSSLSARSLNSPIEIRSAFLLAATPGSHFTALLAVKCIQYTRYGLERPVTRCDSSKGRERKVIRAKDATAGADPATEDPIDPQAPGHGHAANRQCPLAPAGPLGPGTPQGMPLTGIAPWGQRPLRSLPPRVWNGRNQAAVQRACAYLY
jgi:hypothetical protein